MGSVYKFDLLHGVVIGSVARGAVHTHGALVIAAVAPRAPETHKHDLPGLSTYEVRQIYKHMHAHATTHTLMYEPNE